ncbi:MAG: ATP-binding protein [Polaribacter sp.]|nr:ATP-binding protein [Polaribacter sp.]MDG1812304.1 ATP-binding protein [Polaribacter sp.]MDG1993588.1 ATP-binding protein [Polaribacter sp.]
MQQKIVLIGGPGTGKSSILNALTKKGFSCKEEISREVILEAQKKGIDQLFLKDPLLFSNLLLEGREQQFLDAENSKEKLVFFDRGIPDVHAYLEFFNTKYPSHFIEKSKSYLYTKVFMLPPWKEIYTSDNERYESFEEAVKIHYHLKKTYQEIGYKIGSVPFGTVIERTNYILDAIKNDL